MHIKHLHQQQPGLTASATIITRKVVTTFKLLSNEEVTVSIEVLPRIRLSFEFFEQLFSMRHFSPQIRYQNFVTSIN